MKTLIKGGLIINEGKEFMGDLLIDNGRIERIDSSIEDGSATEINAEGLWIIPGIIDDQVHFREPGLTHKASIYTESKAAAAGGVTSYMEMPNTKPSAVTKEELEKKYEIARQFSFVNYSFFMGATNDNLEHVLRTDIRNVCGIKVFMGSSTGNMLVDNAKTLEGIFKNSPMLVATHCEDEQSIRDHLAIHKATYGDEIPVELHPIIRDEDACYLSSSLAVRLAKEHDARLHILHISTEKELELFRNDIPLKEKRITAEVCVHHLHFTADDYATLGAKIKCNPAIKAAHNKAALWKALLDDRLDIIATDHAPHTAIEKNNPYTSCPSGVPLVQHSINLMLHARKEGRISATDIVRKMCHAPADCFDMTERGYLREGHYADIAIIDPDKVWEVHEDNLYYRCKWSPLQGKEVVGRVMWTIVNGEIVYSHEVGHRLILNDSRRLCFDR